MNIGNKYRQNYCDLYPDTRRLGKKRLTRAAVAALTASWCIFFSGLLLAGKFS